MAGIRYKRLAGAGIWVYGMPFATGNETKTMISPGQVTENNPAEQQWDNPQNPEKAQDNRDLEQLERQKKEAELRKANLTEEEGDNETTPSANP